MIDDSGASLSNVAGLYPALVKKLTQFEPVITSSIIAGLLCHPQLQANAYRLETLLHLTLIHCKGTKKPKNSDIRDWFKEIGLGQVGMMEDPSEDVFISNILTEFGNFRIFEGLWEGNGFYTQRFINIVHNMPDQEIFIRIKDAILSILRISEEVCKRTKLLRNSVGEEFPHQKMPDFIARQCTQYRKHLIINSNELEDIGVNIEDLTPFVFDINGKDFLKKQTIGNSRLTRHPILIYNQSIILLNPAAVGIAIRNLVIGITEEMGLGNHLKRALAIEYQKMLKEMPFLGSGLGPSIKFVDMGGRYFSEMVAEIDSGRYLHIISYVDNLVDFEKSNFDGFAPQDFSLENIINEQIKLTHKNLQNKEGFKEGITLLICCGIGRGTFLDANINGLENWELIFLGANDFSTICWSGEVKPITLFRITESERLTKNSGIRLMNPNGFLNQIAWQKELQGNMIPHKLMPESKNENRTLTLSINQNSNRKYRHEAACKTDTHKALFIDSNYFTVHRISPSIFKEDRNIPIYARQVSEGKAHLLLYEGKCINWWLSYVVNNADYSVTMIDRFRLFTTWLPRIATEIEHTLQDTLTSDLHLDFHFFGSNNSIYKTETFMSLDEAMQQIKLEISGNKIVIATTELFEQSFYNPVNVAEHALVTVTVEGILNSLGLSNGELKSNLVNRIVPTQYSRQTHAFEAREFLDFVRNYLPSSPILIDDMDFATLKIGMGWKVRDRRLGNSIKGKQDCLKYINALVDALEEDLIKYIKKFNRKSLADKLITNFLALYVDQKTWHRTSHAVRDLHEDKEDVENKTIEYSNKTNTAIQSCRLLLEIVNCECPINSGFNVGNIDISKALAMINMIMTIGGWSDAIYWDVMEPSIKITEFGDIVVNQQFFYEVVEPFGIDVSKKIFKTVAGPYEKHFGEYVDARILKNIIEHEFYEAWIEEFGFDLDNLRKFVELCEDAFIEKHFSHAFIPLSDFINLINNDEKLTKEMLIKITNAFLYKTRTNWRYIPLGYSKADRLPWKFRRQLSILRMPIIQMDNEVDPLILVAPYLIKESFLYLFTNYYEANFSDNQIKTQQMKSWFGKRRADGEKFNKDVAEVLSDLGWETEHDILLTKVFQIGNDKDIGNIKKLGDIDVLAWDKKSNRILIIECKDIQFKKTPGEIAEQLSKFRGNNDDKGKPDLLKKHLNRLQACELKKQLLARFTNIKEPIIEGYLIFRNPVPMQYANKTISNKISVKIYSEIYDYFAI